MTDRRAYPCDLSDARWALIEPRLTAWRQARTDAGVGGRKAEHDLREIVNAILYVNRTGIPWRYLPHDLPPWATVYGYDTAWTNEGIFAELNYQLTGLVRDKTGRQPAPSASIMDTQSVKTSTNVPTATQGTDAGKKIVGRKRGIVTDTAAASAVAPNSTMVHSLYTRMVKRRGARRALVAVMHKILTAVWHMLSHDLPYHDLGRTYVHRRPDQAERRNRRLLHERADLGVNTSNLTATG
jgi:transposase